jgi:hypothetical protein
MVSIARNELPVGNDPKREYGWLGEFSAKQYCDHLPSVVSYPSMSHTTEENSSDPFELFRSLLHQRTAIQRPWDQVRLVHLGRVRQARFRAIFEPRRVSRNSPCANVHVVALTSSPFDRVARNQGLLSGLRPVETTTYRKANPESGRLLGVPLR